eukprot:gene27949-33752_t
MSKVAVVSSFVAESMAHRELLVVEELMKAVEQCDAEKLAGNVRKHVVSEEEFLSGDIEVAEGVDSFIENNSTLPPRKRLREDNGDHENLMKKPRGQSARTQPAIATEEMQKQMFTEMVKDSVKCFQALIKKVTEVYPDHWDVILRFLEGILMLHMDTIPLNGWKKALQDLRLLFAYAPEITQLIAFTLVGNQHCELLYLVNLLNCMYDSGIQSQTSAPSSSNAGMANNTYVYRQDSVVDALGEKREREALRLFIESSQDKPFSLTGWKEFEPFLRRIPDHLVSDALTWWNPPLPAPPPHLARLLIKGRYVVEGAWGAGVGGGVGRYEVVKIVKELLSGIGNSQENQVNDNNNSSSSSSGGSNSSNTVSSEQSSPDRSADTQDTFTQETEVPTEVAAENMQVENSEEPKESDKQTEDAKEEEGNFLDLKFYPPLAPQMSPLPLPFNLGLLSQTLAPILEEFVNTPLDASTRKLVESSKANLAENARKKMTNTIIITPSPSAPSAAPRPYVPPHPNARNAVQHPRPHYPVPPRAYVPTSHPYPPGMILPNYTAQPQAPPSRQLIEAEIYPLLSRRFMRAFDVVPNTLFQSAHSRQCLRYALESLVMGNDCQQKVVENIAYRWRLRFDWLYKWVTIMKTYMKKDLKFLRNNNIMNELAPNYTFADEALMDLKEPVLAPPAPPSQAIQPPLPPMSSLSSSNKVPESIRMAPGLLFSMPLSATNRTHLPVETNQSSSSSQGVSLEGKEKAANKRQASDQVAASLPAAKAAPPAAPPIVIDLVNEAIDRVDDEAKEEPTVAKRTRLAQNKVERKSVVESEEGEAKEKPARTLKSPVSSPAAPAAVILPKATLVKAAENSDPISSAAAESTNFLLFFYDVANHSEVRIELTDKAKTKRIEKYLRKCCQYKSIDFEATNFFVGGVKISDLSQSINELGIKSGERILAFSKASKAKRVISDGTDSSSK